jgi:rubrerythrin
MESIWRSKEDVLDYAIKAEEQAITKYTSMARSAGSQETRDLLLRLVDQETEHKRNLCAIKGSESFSRVILDLAALDES